MGMKFDNDPLSVEQNNFVTKIVNVYIFYDLETWPRNHTGNFKFKNYLFGATSLVTKNDKIKCVYSDYRITFDSASFWSFDNSTDINVLIFVVDNN